MSTETRWRIVEDGKPSPDDVFFTADNSTAGYIVANIVATNDAQGDTTDIEAVPVTDA